MVEFIGWSVLAIIGLAGYAWLGCFFLQIMMTCFPITEEKNVDGTPKEDLPTCPFDYVLMLLCLSIWPTFFATVLIFAGIPKLCKWIASLNFWKNIDLSWFYSSAVKSAEKLCNYFTPKPVEKKEGE